MRNTVADCSSSCRLVSLCALRVESNQQSLLRSATLLRRGVARDRKDLSTLAKTSDGNGRKTRRTGYSIDSGKH